MKSLGILLSGRGTNFAAIARSCQEGRIPGRIAVVISNRAEALGIEHARLLGLRTAVIPSKGKQREEHDAEVIAALKEAQVDLVCLAGYMRLLSPLFIRAFPQQILNIHPSLLPAFPGLDAQKQAFEHGVKVSGCTVHFVDETMDQGPIIIQAAVPVFEGDTEETLAARVLEQEHRILPQAIQYFVEQRLEISGRRVILKSTRKMSGAETVSPMIEIGL